MPTLDNQPLRGKRVLITRSAEQAKDLIAALERLGATAIPFPTITLAPPPTWEALDDAFERLAEYEWVILTSANSVRFVRQYIEESGKSLALLQTSRLVAIGPGTARALEKLGLTVHIVPGEHVAEALADALGNVAGQRILLPHAAQAREVLAYSLRERGATVDEVALYQTLIAIPDPASLIDVQRGVDIATFTSSSTVHNLLTLLGDQAHSILNHALIACIGPITAETAREHGLRVDVVADIYTIDGLVEAIIRTQRLEADRDGISDALCSQTTG